MDDVDRIFRNEDPLDVIMSEPLRSLKSSLRVADPRLAPCPSPYSSTRLRAQVGRMIVAWTPTLRTRRHEERGGQAREQERRVSPASA